MVWTGGVLREPPNNTIDNRVLNFIFGDDILWKSLSSLDSSRKSCGTLTLIIAVAYRRANFNPLLCSGFPNSVCLVLFLDNIIVSFLVNVIVLKPW